MKAPVLHVLAGPNGSGKSTFVGTVLGPTTRLTFINADEIAAERWPGEEEQHAYDAARTAASARDEAIEGQRSFIAETVFSHPSKVALIERAARAGYLVELHVMLVPEDLAVARVRDRVIRGGHSVPEAKIRERYRRLWALIAAAVPLTNRSYFYDNTLSSQPFKTVAAYQRGRPAKVDWPRWTPAALIEALRSQPQPVLLPQDEHV